MSLYVKRNTVRNITSRVEANILRKLQTTIPPTAPPMLKTVDEEAMEVDDRLVTNTPDRRSKSVELRLTKTRRTGEPREALLTGEPLDDQVFNHLPGGLGTPDRKSKDSSVDSKLQRSLELMRPGERAGSGAIVRVR